MLGTIRLLVLLIAIFLVTWVEDSLIFPAFAIITSVAGIYEYLVTLPFIHEYINSVYLSLNFILLGVGIIVGIAQSISHRFSIIFCIIILVSVTMKLGFAVHAFRCETIRNRFSLFL